MRELQAANYNNKKTYQNILKTHEWLNTFWPV